MDSSLKSLEGDAIVLSGQRLTPAMLVELHEKLKGMQISVLELDDCSLSEMCAEPLARLANSLEGLGVLSVANNKLGAQGVTRLLGGLTAPIRLLRLTENDIGDGAARAIVSYLCYSQCCLDILDMGHNKLGDTFALLLAKHLERAAACEVHIPFNDVTTEGAKALSNALGPSSSVRLIDLRMNYVDPTFMNPNDRSFTQNDIPQHKATSPINSDRETETIDSTDYSRAELRAKMAARLKAIEAQQRKGVKQDNISFTQRMLSLRDTTRRLRAAQEARHTLQELPAPPKRSADEMLEALLRRTGLGQ